MKRLLVSIPSAPNGSYSNELAWWLTAAQVQSSVLDFADALCESSSNIAERVMIRKAAERFAVGWSMEQATLQWYDPRKAPDLGKPLIPPGWSVAMAPVFGGPIAANRNEQVRRALYTPDHDKDGEIVQTDFDAALFIDTDNVPGRHDLHCLLEDIEKDGVQVVGGVYCMEAPEGPKPLVYRITDDYEGFTYDGETLTREMGLHELKGGGLPAGCLLVKREVFERMWEARRVWFKDRLHDASFEYYEIHRLLTQHRGDKAALYDALKAAADARGVDWSIGNIGSWHIGEDIWFCRMCHEMGIPMHVDTRVFWKHIKLHDNKQAFLRQQAIGRRFFEHGVRAAVASLKKGEPKHGDVDRLYSKWARERARDATERGVEGGEK